VNAEGSTGERRIDAWLEALASGAATPGGGAFAALSAAAGVALVAMVGRLTIGKEAFTDVEDRMRRIVEACDRARTDLLALADEDAVAFDAVMAAYRLPKGTDEEVATRRGAIQAALAGAAAVPLGVARRSVDAMALAEEATASGNPNAASDGLSGGAALHAAALAALANVRINATSLADAARRDEILGECDGLRERAGARLVGIEAAFAARLS
jgi:formiminotetrahydrofolate cyclodeaminase